MGTVCMFARASTTRIPAMLLLGIAVLVSGIAYADDAPFGDRGSMWRRENYVGALRHMGEIYFSRAVRRGDTVSDLPHGTMIENLTYRHDGKAVALEDYFTRAHTTRAARAEGRQDRVRTLSARRRRQIALHLLVDVEVLYVHFGGLRDRRWVDCERRRPDRQICAGAEGFGLRRRADQGGAADVFRSGFRRGLRPGRVG